MSRLAALALSVSLLVAPLRAQDSQIVRLRREADSLLRSWREAEMLADVADSLERVRATAGAETLAVGGLRIIANPSPLPLHEAAERAWPILDSLYGSAAIELAQHPYVIRAVDPDTTIRRLVLHVGLELPWDLDIRATTSLLLATVTPPDFDPGLTDWLGGVLRPGLGQNADRAVFVQLVTAPSEAVRRCFLGDLARCEDILQVTDSTGRLMRWYVTPAERQALVTESFNEYFARGATAPTLQRCQQHDDAACTALLQSLPPGTLPLPLSHAARILLVQEALQAGGRDAYRRLVANAHAPMGIRLTNAAGIPLDSLVMRWRDRTLAARPAPLALPWWTGVAAMGWTAFFGFCALRSSRWRL